NSYSDSSPASFTLTKPVYFIQKGSGEIVELPSNKKKLIEMFPDKKEALNIYFKNNKGDYSNKNDLINLANAL
ncbi:MAG: hypothetical protein H7195_01280, partial [Chryseobacterium sp.]|nr:hypothetical protein [Chryseobacterium sp.]